MKSRRLKAIGLTVIVSLLAISILAAAEDGDIDILKKALTKGLGEKTNWGSKRLLVVTKETKGARDALLIVLNANDNPIPSGVRHGILKDVTIILRILKSWDWPTKVEVVVIAEKYPASLQGKKGVGLRFAIASPKICEIDWNSFNPRNIPEVANVTELQ